MKFIKASLRGVKKVFTSYSSVSLIIAVGLCVLIWFFGPRLRIYGYRPFEPTTVRLVAIIAIIFFWGLNNLLVGFLHRRRQERAVEEKVEKVPRDPVKERVDAFDRSFRNAMSAIARHWIGSDGKRGKRSVYSLPWYVMLGFPSAGKTSFIVESNLKFPLAHLFSQEDAKTVTKTEDVDYWVTDDAVVFDVAGQLLTHQRNRADDNILDVSRLLWDKFLGLLNEYRPRRPINGAIVCIDLVDLIQSSPEVRENKAALLHARLVEMSEALSTRYTVHVILTKLDLLDGFHEFVSGLTKAQREEPFGFTFSVYSEKSGDSWVEEFEKAYDGFLERLNNLMLDRIADQHSSEARRKLYTFTRQLSGLKALIGDFLTTSLHQDKFSTAPLVRGVFMASCRQEAVPFNAVLTAASQKYEIRPPVLAVHGDHSKHYFSSNVLKSVIFEEAGLAGDNIRLERAKRARFILSGAAASVLFIGFVGFYWQAYESNRAKMDEVVSIAKTYKANSDNRAANKGDAGRSFLQPLNALRSAGTIFGNYDRWGVVPSFLTLSQGRRIGPVIDKTYIALLQDGFLPDLASYVEADVVELGTADDTRDGDERLEDLRIYLMLGDTAKRNNALVEEWYGEVWQTLYTGDDQTQQDLSTHLKFAVEDANLEVPLNQSEVASAQADLRAVPRDLRLYRNIEQLAKSQLVSAVNFRNEIGPAYNIIFRQPKNANGNAEPVEIPPFFTRTGFTDFFVKQNEALSVVAIEDAWVAGERDTVSYSQEDLDAFRKQVAERYATNYINTWTNALNQLDIVDFGSLDKGVDVLEEITGPDAPFARLIALVKAQTQIYAEKTVTQTPDQAADAKQPYDLYREQGMRINRAFARLDALDDPRDNKGSYLEDLEASLSKLYEYLKEVRQAGDRSGEMALAKAKARVKLEGDDPIYVVERQGVDLPEPMSRFFATISDQSWAVVLDKAKDELQRAWNDDVYGEYNLSLATRYPFTMDAQEDVPLKEFTDFFGPNGKIENFYNDNLSLFIDDATGKPKVIDGQSLVINSEFLVQLKKALALQDSYFGNDGALGVNYTVEPKGLSGRFGRSVMNVEGQLVPYSHGPRFPVRIIWPNELSKKAESVLTLFPSGGGRPRTMSFSGPWSGYRLLNSGKIVNYDSNGTVVEFDVGGGTASYTITQQGQKNPARQDPLADLVLPARL
ncbi:type VI secretion system membrane subunit TssM [Martelella mangrovi]|uniref:type VI secretion system membrane subunit TssM n=1 Tax=Martelella mangrovi TaxID=1397477 RepID=UPI00339631D3